MAEDDIFQSIDSARHADELAHARHVTFDGPFDLEIGGELPSVTVAYETYGQLNPERDNAVLICHAISGDSHVAKHDEADNPGWWDIAIGPGKAIDTNRYFVICPNILGGCRGTTGPNTVNPDTGRPYGPDFPLITVGDMVRAQARLVAEPRLDDAEEQGEQEEAKDFSKRASEIAAECRDEKLKGVSYELQDSLS